MDLCAVRRIVKLIERGISHRRIHDYKTDSEIQCRRGQRQFRKDLKIADVFSAYVVLTLGALLGFVFALIEKLLHSVSQSRRPKGAEDPISIPSITIHSIYLNVSEH